jgi:hypothetical protein
VLFSTNDSEGLFGKEYVKPITPTDPLRLRHRHGGPIPGSISDELQSRMIKDMGLLRKKRKKGKHTKKAKKEKQTKKGKKAKKDKQSKKAKDKKTKKTRYKKKLSK